MIVRPRRLRKNKIIRDMAAETRLSPSMLVYPVFIREGSNIIEDIPAMPGQKRYSPDTFPRILEEVQRAGVNSILLFGIPEHKDEFGSEAYNENGVIQQALRVGKIHFPDMCFIGDVCLCEYTSHGHCGLLKGETVDNDPTLDLLAKTALSQAQAGADIVAPSDMMDGRVAAIRAKLDGAGMDDTLIFSYAVKYASAFYGPFREAAGSAPSFGDRKSYQMDPRNVREGVREALLDIEEGADMIMVKPGLPYLDVLRAVKEASEVPVGAYCVSGEYSMIKAAVERGWLDEKRVIAESAVCLARGGADVIVSYFAPELAKMMKEGEL
ncbi:porphobilinogen synthase [Cloacibacillus porcorum]|jgi:porphobilinogen synthase|uniref:porphobilinogen synthase n=1 Tax=Cloacibacillus porcorum TaxID=1197717 RepID=UPI002354B0F5|nr:porphobilinogen synthase [Cloacibacillus porcorum]MCI5864684.1 porphobilinogen synthase [Cloacibacillus porcorum]MDD7648037.1 porphobilinogen synthase [Cloacibacillus porcorum]MDY4094602.1 porphobilinogen synthase [Cloacibacillus porcorum]